MYIVYLIQIYPNIEFQNTLIMGFSLIKGEISDVVNVR